MWCALISIAVAGSWLVWNWLLLKRSTDMLQRWATQQGYQVLHAEIALGRPLLAAASSMWGTLHASLEYSVTLRDAVGLTRSASVSVGRFVCGAYSCDPI